MPTQIMRLVSCLVQRVPTMVQVVEERFPSPNQAQLILGSWKEIQISLDEIGFEAFKKLFSSHSDIKARETDPDPEQTILILVGLLSGDEKAEQQ